MIGTWEEEVRYKSQIDKLSVIVLEGAGPSHLSRGWLQRFN